MHLLEPLYPVGWNASQNMSQVPHPKGMGRTRLDFVGMNLHGRGPVVERPGPGHVLPNDVNRQTEVDRLSRLACSDFLGFGVTVSPHMNRY